MGLRTIQILDDLSTTLRGASDYAIAKALGVTRATVSTWRVGKGTMSDDVAIRAAKILKRDTGDLLLVVAEERATTDIAKKAWTNLARQLRAGAAVGIIGALAFTGFQPAKAMDKADSYCAKYVYYVK